MAYTDRRRAADAGRIEIFLRSSTVRVFLEIRNVAHETQTLLRRVLQAEQTLLNFHLSHYAADQKQLLVNWHNCVLSNAGLSNGLTETGICTSMNE